VSIMMVHNILYWKAKVNFADIPWEKPKITPVAIH
jgi:hypothetical protein